MQNVRDFYTERVGEIDSFLTLIETIQIASRDGAPWIGDVGKISVDHQKILISTAYIQMYSLLESTIGQSLTYIANQVVLTCDFKDLNDTFKQEWADFQLRNYTDNVTSEGRSKMALRMVKHILEDGPLTGFKIEKRNAKGWDRKIVDSVVNRVGIPIEVSVELDKDLKIHYSNDMAPLTFLKKRRSQLAHGEISFVQAGEVNSIEDLKRLRNLTCEYLNAVLNSFQTFLDTQAYRRVETTDDFRSAAPE